MKYKTKEPDHNFTHNEPPKLLIKRTTSRSWEVRTPTEPNISNAQLKQNHNKAKQITGIIIDPVSNKPGPIQTGSIMIPVNKDTESDQNANSEKISNIQLKQNHNKAKQITGIIIDPVSNKPGPIQTGSIMIPVSKDVESIIGTEKNKSIHPTLYQISKTNFMSKEEIISQHLKWENDIIGIPQELLRTKQVWNFPIDFMCYLHFFSHSFGRGRRWCNMGILELQKFCGSPQTPSGKNTIRNSIERLSFKKLIECIEAESPNQKSKKWLIRTPFEAGICCTKESYFPNDKPPRFEPGLKQTRFKSDPDRVQNKPREGSNQTLSGSKTDTYKDNIQTSLKDSFKISLSHHEGFSERWKNLPKRSREREEEVIQALIQKYPEDIQNIFDELQHLETTRVDHFEKPCGSPIGLIESSWPTMRLRRQENQKKERALQVQKAQEAKDAQEKMLTEHIQAETDEIVDQRYNDLTDTELDEYITRVQKQYPIIKTLKGSAAATAMIKSLIHDDLNLKEYESRKQGERLNLQEKTISQAITSENLEDHTLSKEEVRALANQQFGKRE